MKLVTEILGGPQAETVKPPTAAQRVAQGEARYHTAGAAEARSFGPRLDEHRNE